MSDIRILNKIAELCIKSVTNRNRDDLIQLQSFVHGKKNWQHLPRLQRGLTSAFYQVLKNSANNQSNLTEDNKLIIVDILDVIYTHTKLDHEVVFFNFLGFLLHEIYDVATHKIKSVSEEYKLAVISCVKSLFNSTSSELSLRLYNKANGKRFSLMIHVTVEIITHENFKSLKLEGINCLMALFKVYSDEDYSDLELRSLVAECCFFFFPGVTLCLRNVALGDDKVGYKVIKLSIKAIGRILSLLLKDYTAPVNTSMLSPAAWLSTYYERNPRPTCDTTEISDSSKGNKMKEYMESSRSPEWFHKCDVYLAPLLMGSRKLTQHPMREVREELGEMCNLFFDNCEGTIRKSFRYILEIVIILSDDEDPGVKEISKTVMEKIGNHRNTICKDALHDGFYETISEITNVFNGIDDREKIAALKLTAGYINLLGKDAYFNNGFGQFMRILLHISQFDIDVSTYSESPIQVLEDVHPFELWNNLIFLRNELVRKQFTYLCQCLSSNDLFEVIADFAISVFHSGEDTRPSTYLLNELILGLKTVENKQELIKPIFFLYIDPDNWNIPLTVTSDLFSDSSPLTTISSNIQQAALSVFGIGIMAHVLEKEFRPFLLQSVYLVLTRAGSKQSLIQAAGKKAMKYLSDAFNDGDCNAFINDHMDYLLFYIDRSFRRNFDKQDAFIATEVILICGNKSTTNSVLHLLEEVLEQSFKDSSRKWMNSYLEIFRAYMKSLLKLFNVPTPAPIMKSKAQKKEEELQNFTVTGLDGLEEINDFSDNIMGKSAEEFFTEDMKQKENEHLEPEVEEYKKPKPPDHIILTAKILRHTLCHLPAKEKSRKLLVLEILNDGIEILKDSEDELLPLVHEIWSPLVPRFKEVDAPVVVNYSFQLLSTLARVSKEFIRIRTVKEVLPNILDILRKLSLESYKKDRGSAYRYTQSYKLQLVMIERLGYLVADISLMEEDIEKIMDVVINYLDNKQPLPLQQTAVNFFRHIIYYDPIFQDKIKKWLTNENCGNYEKNLNYILNNSENKTPNDI